MTIDGQSSDNLVVGVEQAVINPYPNLPFSKSKDTANDASSSSSICLCDYKDGEMLRMMPGFRHFFHLCCLYAWLRLNGSWVLSCLPELAIADTIVDSVVRGCSAFTVFRWS